MANRNDAPRLMLAAAASGGGKTTVTLGLLRCLLERDLRPAAFKCGPDYIDPMFHREVLGIPGRNLDLYFTDAGRARALFARGMRGRDIAVVEGVMGFYDGVGGTDRASSWEAARETETPVVFVVQPRGAFLSLAALVDGFTRFRDDSMIRGILLNQCGERLCAKLTPMLERETGLKVFGAVPDVPEATIASRHLGLVTPDTIAALRDKLGILGERMRQTTDIDGLIRLAESAPPLPVQPARAQAAEKTPVRIAVAADSAFCFYYEENFELLRDLGAELAFFSPLRDARIPDGAGGLYLGGGYPELHAETLAGNASMRESIKNAVQSGLPTVAECGGFLYLQTCMEDPTGVPRVMAGALPGVSRNSGKLGRFGYVELEAERDTLLVRKGERVRAHEFHYWDSDANGDAFTARKPADGAEWRCVAANERLHAGFPHLYFWNEPTMAKRFVEAARNRQ